MEPAGLWKGQDPGLTGMASEPCSPLTSCKPLNLSLRLVNYDREIRFTPKGCCKNKMKTDILCVKMLSTEQILCKSLPEVTFSMRPSLMISVPTDLALKTEKICSTLFLLSVLHFPK